MREQIKVFSKSNIRAIGEDRRTRIELKDAKGNLGGSYGKRNGSRKLDSTEFIHNAVRESVALVSSRKNDHTAPISTVREVLKGCLLYTSPSPRDGLLSRMPSS